MRAAVMAMRRAAQSNVLTRRTKMTCARAQVTAMRQAAQPNVLSPPHPRTQLSALQLWWQIIDQRHKSQRIAIYMALPSTIARPHANRL